MMAWEPSSRTWLKALTCLPGKEKIPEHRAATSNEDTLTYGSVTSRGRNRAREGRVGGDRWEGQRCLAAQRPRGQCLVIDPRPHGDPVPTVPKVKTPPERAALCHAQTGTGCQLSVPGSLGPGKQQPLALGEQTSSRGS